jgi:hypothetical protein
MNPEHCIVIKCSRQSTGRKPTFELIEDGVSKEEAIKAIPDGFKDSGTFYDYLQSEVCYLLIGLKEKKGPQFCTCFAP